MLIVIFIGFASVNLGALQKVKEQRSLLVSLAEAKLEKSDSESAREWRDLLESTRPSSIACLKAFHWTIDAMVVAAIWLMPTVLARANPLTHFLKKEVQPIASPLEAAVVSWNQANQVWVLEREYTVESRGRVFTIPAKFEFDLASIPRILWWILAPFELSVVAPLVHDFLYRNGGRRGVALISESADVVGEHSSVGRLEADQIFLDLMEQEGVSRLRRVSAYYSVHFMGAKFWQQPPKKQSG